MPDGKYGTETREVVAKFQRQNGLYPVDGIAGRNTLRKLDQRLVARSRPKPAAKVVRPSPKKKSPYIPGLRDPHVPMDPPRAHGCVKATLRGKIIHQTLYLNVSGSAAPVSVIWGQDAAKAMRHYLGNSGARYEVRFRRLVAQEPDVLTAFKEEINQVKAYVEALPPGTHTMVSSAAKTLSAYASKNWALTVGGFNAWGKGRVIIREDRNGRTQWLNYSYKFKDRYNFDPEKGFGMIQFPIKVKNFDVPFLDGDVLVRGDELEVRDTLLMKLHSQGLAKNFITYGSVDKHISWRNNDSLPPDAYNPLRS